MKDFHELQKEKEKKQNKTKTLLRVHSKEIM